jgi:tRNA U34 5-methylaminomethyl-2-thiouridine-forming methyltransferase MnmC
LIKRFEQIGFSLETTKDLSPTLRTVHQNKDDNEKSKNASLESMHHSGGAATETYYIYGSVLKYAQQIFEAQYSTCIVGLGLGYIEYCWALTQLPQNHQPQPLHQLSKSTLENTLTSFEINPELQNLFLEGLQTESKSSELLEFSNAIIKHLTPHFKLDLFQPEESISTSVKHLLTEALKAKRFQLENDFISKIFNQSAANLKWNVICYDAFSQKTNSELWQESFLENLIENFTQPNCLFTTYACTGSLKRALKKYDFRLLERPGFNGKRDSTLAVRGELLTNLKSFSQIF